MNTPLWQPHTTAIHNSQLWQFIELINHKHQLQLQDYAALHQWSIAQPALFWSEVWDFCGIKGHKGQRVIDTANKLQDTRWFSDSTLNFADNLLSRHDDHPAIIYADENGNRQTITYHTLHQQVAKFANYLQSIGVSAGDRVVGFLPNPPTTLIAMLASAGLGAVWSACSADFGLQGLLDRFSQIQPKVLIATDQHHYQGKSFSHIEMLAKLQQALPSLQQTIIVPNQPSTPNLSTLKNTITFQQAITSQPTQIEWQPFPFAQPLYILYSSGTTGKPKCMVHGAGNTLIQHVKELTLHTNLTPQDNIFFFTTCGWMMWHWLVSSLAVGATVVLYEGAPFYPTPSALFDLIDEVDISIFGVGAKIIEGAAKANLKPMHTHKLNSLRCILTTGSPLLPESFDYVYQNIKKDIRLSSISGGSDIIACFALGNPILPVYRGELQCIGLGMNVKILDTKGHAVINQKGELTCHNAFPSMPLYFWNDQDGSKYQQAYFNQYPNIWAHGDYACITHHHGLIIYGRSDATLNPSGVRIGTAEIYNQVEKIDAVIDCMAIGQAWEGSERIILFVQLRQDESLTDSLIQTIKHTIRDNTSPKHVPAKIIQVPELPRTISGKLVELAVKNIIHHQPVKNVEALANPDALDFFKQIDELSN